MNIIQVSPWMAGSYHLEVWSATSLGAYFQEVGIESRTSTQNWEFWPEMQALLLYQTLTVVSTGVGEKWVLKMFLVVSIIFSTDFIHQRKLLSAVSLGSQSLFMHLTWLLYKFGKTREQWAEDNRLVKKHSNCSSSSTFQFIHTKKHVLASLRAVILGNMMKYKKMNDP